MQYTKINVKTDPRLGSEDSTDLPLILITDQEIFWGTAPAISILAKWDVLRNVTRHSKYRLKYNGRHFVTQLMNKHKP